MVLFISNNFIRTYSFETTNYLTINYQQYLIILCKQCCKKVLIRMAHGVKK